MVMPSLYVKMRVETRDCVNKVWLDFYFERSFYFVKLMI